MRSGLGENPLWRAAAGVAGLLALATVLAAGVLLLLGSAEGRNGERAAESEAGASQSVDGPPGRRANPSADRADEGVGSGSKVSLSQSRDDLAMRGKSPVVGGAHSAGCLRTHDSVVIALMEDLPLGTPVTIRA